jgi:hypothetical protein
VLCFTNKQIHHEGLRAWLRRSRFVVHYGDPAVKRLRGFSDKVDGFPEVRTLSFLNQTGYGLPPRYYAYHNTTLAFLAAACPGSRRLSVNFVPLMLFEDTKSYKPKSPRKMVESLDLDNMHGLKSLRQLTVSIRDTEQLGYFAHVKTPRFQWMSNLEQAIKQVLGDTKEQRRVKLTSIQSH